MARTPQLLKNTTSKKIYQRTPRPRFEISTVIDEFQGMNQNLIVNDGYKGVSGTSNPYQFNLFSDLITNPSSVSISEFQKMVYTQPVLKVGLTILSNLVVNEFGEYYHKNAKYKDFINEMIRNLDRSFDDILRDMMTYLWAGFSLLERRDESDGRYIVTKDLEPRPAQSIIYRVDSQGHLKDDGIVQYYFNNLWSGYGNLLAFNQYQNGQSKPNPYAARGDFDYPWRTVWAQPIGTVVIPKDKCVHTIHKGLDGLTSPYGRSLLRDCYDYYVLKCEQNRITRNAANTLATPIPAVVVNPNQFNTTSNETVMDDIASILEGVTSPGGANYLLFQGEVGKSIWFEKFNHTAKLDDFIELNRYYDTMMLTSVLFPSELAGLSDKGSYALGETQNDLLGRNVESIKKTIKNSLIQGWIKPLLKMNFNEEHDFGEFLDRDNITEDIAINLDKINTLHNLGFELKEETLCQMLDIPENSLQRISMDTTDGEKPAEGGNHGNYNDNKSLNDKKSSAKGSSSNKIKAK